jgi:hypothetical protein
MLPLLLRTLAAPAKTVAEILRDVEAEERR